MYVLSGFDNEILTLLVMWTHIFNCITTCIYDKLVTSLHVTYHYYHDYTIIISQKQWKKMILSGNQFNYFLFHLMLVIMHSLIVLCSLMIHTPCFWSLRFCTPRSFYSADSWALSYYVWLSMFSIPMGNDVTSWRASIGIFNNKRQRCLRLDTFHVNTIHILYQLVWSILSRIIIMLRELAYLAKICTSDTKTVCLTCFILLVYNFIKYNGVNKSHIANNYVHTQNTAYATISMAVINPILIIDTILLLSGDIETNPGPVDNIKQCLSIIH